MADFSGQDSAPWRRLDHILTDFTSPPFSMPLALKIIQNP
jgi:hypothetical protein